MIALKEGFLKSMSLLSHDVLQVGYNVDGCNKLRLWRADACDVFDFDAFNQGDYLGSVECVFTETISKVLYPNDGTCQGKRLRLKHSSLLHFRT